MLCVLGRLCQWGHVIHVAIVGGLNNRDKEKDHWRATRATAERDGTKVAMATRTDITYTLVVRREVGI